MIHMIWKEEGDCRTLSEGVEGHATAIMHRCELDDRRSHRSRFYDGSFCDHAPRISQFAGTVPNTRPRHLACVVNNSQHRVI